LRTTRPVLDEGALEQERVLGTGLGRLGEPERDAGDDASAIGVAERLDGDRQRLRLLVLGERGRGEREQQGENPRLSGATGSQPVVVPG